MQPRAFKGVSPAHHASLLHVFVFGLVHQRLTPRGESSAVVGGIRPPLVVSSQQGESQAGDTSRRPKRDVFNGALARCRGLLEMEVTIMRDRNHEFAI